ncbi:hypothetical protein FACS189472_08110 [Alphaproteobacteria bacterium]|nr:hypothetical protein FACS189472_08110 [Alphaproteobacteria bacterium]
MMTNSITVTALLVIMHAIGKNDKEDRLLCSLSLTKISIVPTLTILSMPLLPFFYGEFLIIYSVLCENRTFGVLLCSILMPGMFLAIKAFCTQFDIGIEKKISCYDFFYLIPPAVFIAVLGTYVTSNITTMGKYVSWIIPQNEIKGIQA